MKYLFLEYITIISYLFNPYIGFAISLFAYISIFLNRKYSNIDKLIISIVFSLPTFNISILGDNIFHVLSWNIILTFFLIIYLLHLIIKNRIKLNSNVIFIFSLFIILLINCFFEVSYKSALIEYFQIISIVLPIYLIIVCEKKLVEEIKTTDIYFEILNNVIVATTLSLISQYILYYKFNVLVGNWIFYPGRTSIDLIFKGASVLSLFIGMAIPINIYNIYRKRNVKYFVYLIILLTGIFINSARTGLVAGTICSIPIIINEFNKHKRGFYLTFMALPISIIGIYQYTNMMLENRGTKNIISENGRFFTYNNGINQIMSSFKNFMFGSGLSLENYNFVMPHNVIIETLMTMGFINTIILLILFIKFIKKIYYSKYKYIFYSIILGSMFITNFFGNNFVTIVSIIVFFDSCKNKLIEECNYD